MIKLKMELDINQKDIYNAILKEIAKELNKVLIQVVSDDSVKTQIKELISSQIKSSPEAESLLYGELGAVFGLTNPGPAIESIIETINANTEITYSPAVVIAGALNASITVSVLKSDFSDVLGLSSSSYDTSDFGKVPWLEWLLKSGDDIVIGDYTAVLIDSPLSRTGRAIMKKSSRGFRVPPEYSGTVTNNWLTRALEDLEHPLGNIIFLELDRRIS